MVIIMQNSDIFEKDRNYIAHTYHRFPAAIKNGHGAQAEDYEGKKYIDFGSGIGTNSLGLCNSKWVQAVVSQVSQLQHTSNLFYTLPDGRSHARGHQLPDNCSRHPVILAIQKHRLLLLSHFQICRLLPHSS